MASTLADVLITEELTRRPRPPDFEAEARALGTLAADLARDPGGLLQAVVELTITVCRAHSAGVSVLDPHHQPAVFRWHAIAGACARHAGTTVPRDASPCAHVVLHDSLQLFDRPARHFSALREVVPPIYEALLTPWPSEGQPVATLWAFAHTPGRHFDAEDARLIRSLARVAAAAWQISLTNQATTRDAAASHHDTKERLRLITESVREYAIISADSTGIITHWNEGAARIFGYTAYEAIGQHTGLIFTSEDRDAGIPNKEMRRASQGACAEDERWHLHKSGGRIYISGIITALRTDGELTGFVKIARDTTPRREREESLRHSHDELEERVRQRTVELTDLANALQTELRKRRAAETRIKGLFTRLITVQEDERRRIARDIHDQIGQQITALRMNLETVRQRCQADPEAAECAEHTVRLAQGLDESIDFLTWDLRPMALDHLGLRAALETMVRDWSGRFRIAAEYHDVGMNHGRLPELLETHLYRIAQEALHNVYRHADARNVAVLLERSGDQVKLVIEDDGCGFDPEGSAGARAGMGLLGMRERAALIGGEVEIESGPGNGTAVYVRVLLSGAD